MPCTHALSDENFISSVFVVNVCLLGLYHYLPHSPPPRKTRTSERNNNKHIAQDGISSKGNHVDMHALERAIAPISGLLWLWVGHVVTNSDNLRLFFAWIHMWLTIWINLVHALEFSTPSRQAVRIMCLTPLFLFGLCRCYEQFATWMHLPSNNTLLVSKAALGSNVISFAIRLVKAVWG